MDVVVTVGSDHHPFDRLVRWVDEWAGRNAGASVWIQHGPANPPEHAAGTAFASHEELLERVRGASAVVTSAGPGTVMEVRDAGLLPIIVPRRGALEECVDDHQQAFARRLAESRMAISCERADELWAALDQVSADPVSVQLVPAVSHEPSARARVGDLIDGLIAERRG